MAGLLKTLLRPDREDDPERAQVARAANLLQVGEFQLLQLAYFAWHGEELPEALSDEIFRSYMLRDEVPAWARHYARRVLLLDELGDLDDRDPRYHRYDTEYFKALPLGVRRLTWVICCLAFLMVGALAVGYVAPVEVTSMHPPFFTVKQLSPDKNDDLQGP